MSLFPPEVLNRYDEQIDARVIGMDTASNRFHWCSNFDIGIDGARWGWVTCKNSDPDIRRNELIRYAWMLFASIEGKFYVYCEEPLALQNGKTTRLLGLAAGGIYAAFNIATSITYSPEWNWVDQSSWKKKVLGRGIRPKGYGLDIPQAKREKAWICATLSESAAFQHEQNDIMLEDFAAQQDLYDAWALKAYGMQQERQKND
jgi:hypothetical protein